MPKLRSEFLYLLLLPMVIAAAGVLGYYTWETASRYDKLGASSIAHTTLLLVQEKVDRIEQQIISRDTPCSTDRLTDPTLRTRGYRSQARVAERRAGLILKAPRGDRLREPRPHTSSRASSPFKHLAPEIDTHLASQQ